MLSWIAGGGKTNMLLVLLSWLLRPKADNFVVIAAPTNSIVKDLYERIIKHVDSTGILRLAVEHDGQHFQDLGENFLQNIINDITTEEVRILNMLDRIIDLVYETKVQNGIVKGDEKYNILCERFICHILAARHIYNDAHVYATDLARQQDACASLKAVVTTTSNLLKMNAQVSMWSDMMPSGRPMALIIDEVEGEGSEAMAGLLAPFDMAVLMGDRYQAPWYAQRSTWDVGGTELLKGTRKLGTSELRATTAIDWAEKNTEIQISEGWEEMRYGNATVELLREVFTPTFDRLSCPQDQPETLVLPVQFPNLRDVHDWSFANDEILQSSTVFSALLTILALEMVIQGTSPPETKSILVVGFLWQPLRQMEAFVRAELGTRAHEAHRLWGLPYTQKKDDPYDVEEWLRT